MRIVACRFCGWKIYRWGNKVLNVKANSHSGKDEPHTCDPVTKQQLKEFRERNSGRP